MCLVQTVSDKLSTWLNYECRSRGWSHRQLGDRSGISGAMISRVIAEKQSAGWDFCKAMADTLGKDPVEVFRMAGPQPALTQYHFLQRPALSCEVCSGYSRDMPHKMRSPTQERANRRKARYLDTGPF